MAEDPEPRTLQERIALLNASHLGQNPGPSLSLRPKPQLPKKRLDVSVRQHSVNIPPAAVTVSVPTRHNGPNGIKPNGFHPPPPKAKATPPPLPVRRPSESPALPLRTSSEQSDRREFLDSATSSLASGISGISLGAGEHQSRSKSRESLARTKAPAWDPGVLPSLPTKTPAQESNGHSTSVPSSSSINVTSQAKATKPSLPPRLPLRQNTQSVSGNLQHSEVRQATASRPSALSFGLNSERVARDDTPVEISEVGSENLRSISAPGPPPVPLASRPDLSKIQSTKPKHASSPFPSSEVPCMLCRDFGEPDSHATRFPRHTLPQQNALVYLAEQLTAPFLSRTDKARAIFTWLHHNILYDVQSFFAGTVRPSTPASTLASGLAVCEGFAGLFTTLATHAGLESLVISGHGKGFGYTALQPGQAIPPFQGNHAWNVVKIDGDEWKLIDTCWGAGHVQGAGMPYAQKFDPKHFTMTNEEFGTRHFPNDRTQFYLPGNAGWSWEEYIQINPAFWPYTVEQPTVFSNATEEHGVGPRTILPTAKKLNPRRTGRIRFQFGLICEHATLDRHVRRGPPFVYILAIHGLDGRRDDFIPLEHMHGQNPGGGGDIWYADVEARELGAPGQTVTLFAVTSFGNRKGEACRGLSVREFKEGKGRTAMGFQGVLGWELA